MFPVNMVQITALFSLYWIFDLIVILLSAILVLENKIV